VRVGGFPHLSRAWPNPASPADSGNAVPPPPLSLPPFQYLVPTYSPNSLCGSRCWHPRRKLFPVYLRQTGSELPRRWWLPSEVEVPPRVCTQIEIKYLFKMPTSKPSYMGNVRNGCLCHERKPRKIDMKE
jgi:hypothetical protein